MSSTRVNSLPPQRLIRCLLLYVVVVLASAMPARAQVQDWVARYNGAANGSDHALAIAVDSAGNVHVAGYSVGEGTGFDYLTIKYNPNGTQAWVQRYTASGNGTDIVNALAIDDAGNVYVTGYSTTSANDTDFATIKYDTNGTEIWVRKYNGPSNGIDIANDLAIDDEGNLYVTGRSFGSNTSHDYLTVKYDANGTEIWVRRYNGPVNAADTAIDLAVDDTGNIYVTGISEGTDSGDDYVTIKYDPEGTVAWLQRYNALGNGRDRANALAVDRVGNVYVTGHSYVPGSLYDYATIKYNPNGTLAWVQRYNGPGNIEDYPSSLAVDDLGNVYVTGDSWGSNTNGNDHATIKYGPNGTEAWVKRYNGQGSGNDSANALAVDSAGNVYVTGHSIGSGTSYDFTTIKYAPNGAQAWAQIYNGPGNSIDVAYAMALDSTGNVYVAGHSAGVGTSLDATTIKYSPMAIASFSPASGPAGTVVTITGTGFTGATAVKFNGAPATVFSVVSPTQIRANVPAGATTGKISVTSPAATVTSAANFTVTVERLYARDVAVAGDGSVRILLVGATTIRILRVVGIYRQAGEAYPIGPGWTPVGIAAGFDGRTHLLWRHTTGLVSLWRLNGAGVREFYHAVGPYSGWTPRDIGAASDGSSRILYTTASQARIVRVTGATPQVGPAYPIFAGWTPVAIAGGLQARTHVLWRHTSGLVSLWRLNINGVRDFYTAVGPYTGWTATSIGSPSDGSSTILYRSATHIRVVKVTGATPQIGASYPIGPGWTPTALAGGPEVKSHVLWTHTSGLITLWRMNSAGTREWYLQMGPF